jgi:hypothetical protein
MLAASTAAVAPRPVVVLPRLPVIPLPVLLSFLPPFARRSGASARQRRAV